MSKRRRMKTTRDSRVLVIPDRRDLVREREILAQPANAFYGTVVERLVDRLHASDCTAQEAVNIGLTLQQLLRGEAALLNNLDDPGVAEQVAKLREQAAAEDRANQDWQENQDRFVQRVYDKADKILPPPAKRDQVVAQAMQQLSNARSVAQARMALQREEFARRLATDPQVEVYIEPEYEKRTVNGVVAEVQIKPVLRILDKTFVLELGRQYLPQVLAERYAEHRRTAQENTERQKVLQAYMEKEEFERRMGDIDRKYGNRQQNLAL